MKFTYLKSTNAGYIDELFARYRQDPDSIDPSWKYFFDGLELGQEVGELGADGFDGPGDAAPAGGAAAAANGNGQAGTAYAAGHVTRTNGRRAEDKLDLSAEAKVAELIGAYREHGRLLANLDPLTPPPASHPLLELSRFGLGPADLERVFSAGKLIGMGSAKLSEIMARLKDTYCGTIAVECTHITDPAERAWLQGRMESTANHPALDRDTQKLLLKRLIESELFERFLHTRYVAQKRFSIEGGESTILMLDCAIEAGAELGASEFVMGMAHRGRLNVLRNVFGKKAEAIFTEFEGHYKTELLVGEGDVKYHMGYSSDFTTRKGHKAHLSLASNPSHLEFVNPVVEGMARAKQDFHGDRERSKVVPILIHGDAAFAGQGVCYETIQMSQLPGYATGGTLHIVINNQVGFTASPKDLRSTQYCSDLALMLRTPIFHVNGDDPEACWHVARLCTEYRQRFKKDAFIDLICYRKHGHNEGDEPSYTQPLLYKKIKAHPSTRELFEKRLIEQGVLGESEVQALVDAENQALSEAQARTKAENPQPYVSALEGRWHAFRRPGAEDLAKTVATAVAKGSLQELAEKINRVPPGFQLHPKLARFFEGRLGAVRAGKGIDWGSGEALAYASLLNEGSPIRLSGQDAERGTFSHRHSVLNDFETGETYVPLNHIREGQAPFQVFNSHLSETGVLGFEYGYSLSDPETLVIWEAQFGDFANGGQVIVDQFIATSEAKWQRMTGLVLLLPHGYEGQGPEHSSARLERFLQLSGKGNLVVCNLTTPAQFFHAMRRQVKRDFRKPMVLMSPKSLLRHPQAVSALEDFSEGGFQEALDEAEAGISAKPDSVKRVLLCSGKIYYELCQERAAQGRQDTAILRLEQLYPWPAERLERLLGKYRAAQSIAWIQEEPRNMGAWSYVSGMWTGGYERFADKAGGRTIQYIGRELCAAPAVGSAKLHEKEQKALLTRAFSEI